MNKIWTEMTLHIDFHLVVIGGFLFVMVLFLPSFCGYWGGFVPMVFCQLPLLVRYSDKRKLAKRHNTPYHRSYLIANEVFLFVVSMLYILVRWLLSACCSWPPA